MAAANYTALTGPLADFIVGELEANEAAVIAAITSAYGTIDNAVIAALKSAPKSGGLLGVVFPVIESGIQNYAQSLLKQYGPAVVFAFLDREAHLLAAEVGG